MEFPASLRTVAQGAFGNCRNLRGARFNEGLEVLGTDKYTKDSGLWAGVFYASALERVGLPSTLKRIEYNAFQGCENLKSIDFPKGLEYLGKNCFAKSALESVELPDSLRTVAQGAFAGCKSLKSVKFGEGLETLGMDERASDGKQWGGVFESTSVERVELPSTLKRIEYSAFENCKNLKIIDLPEGLEHIGERCF